MRKKSLLLIIPLIMLLLISFAEIPSSFAESYSASAMRLLRYSGAVQIFDAAGAPRFLLENVRFASGESMETGEDGTASVSLDDSKIVSLDNLSFVEFIRESDHIRLNLKKGTIFLDVSEKLDENAGLDIQTSTMTVGIRGTIVQVSEEQSASDAPVTTLAVLEGITNVTYTDEAGSSRLISVSAGKKLSVPKKQSSGVQGVDPVVSDLTAADIRDITIQQISSNPELIDRVTGGSPQGPDLLNGSGGEEETPQVEAFPADGDWLYTEVVTLVAQSASKLYDGTPLTHPGALVSGLPAGLKINLKVDGSITDAGTEKNTVTSWTILNSSGEDVTSHFTNVQTLQGDLVVDPAPLYVWTGSAEKVYDGTPLTCDEAEIHTVEGHVSTDPDWKNSSIVTRTALGSERMVALTGNTLVHGTNPLTGQSKETTLKTGQALTVALHSEGGQDSIDYVIEKLNEDTLPDEAVRLYADNPALLAAACAETGWDPEKILARASSSSGATTTRSGLKVTEDSGSDLVINATNVRIQVDSDFISYDSRALDGSEAKFSPIRIDPSIKVTATGFQTEIGSSINTCIIDWGTAKRGNYVIREDLGTLTVLEPEKPQITVTANSGEKAYDGRPLEVSTFHVTGLPAGWTARAIFSGSRTDVGTSYNTISTITIRDENDEVVTDKCSVILNPGTLTVSPAVLTVTTGSAQKNYDGEPLTCDEASLSGLVNGETADVTATGSQTEVGSSQNTYSISWGTAEASNYTVSEELGTLEVKEADDFGAAITITAASATAQYSGSELKSDDYTVTGLPAGYNVVAEISGGQTDAGSSANSVVFYQIMKDSEDYTSRFTNVTLEDGTLTVTPYVLSFDCGGMTFTFQDEILAPAVSCNGTSATGDLAGDGFVEATFNLSDTGDTAYLRMSTYPLDCMEVGEFNVSASFDVDPGDRNNYTASFTNTIVTVKKRKVTVYKPTETRTYDGYPGPQTTDIIKEGDIKGVVDVSIDNWDELGPDAGTYPFKLYTHVDDDCMDGIELDLSGNGELIINPADLNISSPEQHFAYSGTPHSLQYEDVTVSGLTSSDGLELLLSNNSVIKGGEAVQPAVSIEWGDTNPANYVPNISIGKIYVDKAPLTIKTGSASKDYDGNPLATSQDDYTIEGTVCGSDQIIIRITGEQTDVGSSDNTFEVDYDHSVNAECYDITPEYGTLTVNPAAEDDNLYFDFTPTEVSSVDYYFHATLTYKGEEIMRTSESTSDGGSTYIAYFMMDNGDQITLTVSGLPAPSDTPGTYTLTLQANVAPGSSGDSRTYTPQYLHTTITKSD